MGAGGAQEVGGVGEQEEGAGKEYRIKGKLHLIMEKVDSRGDLHQEITHSRWRDRCVYVYVYMYVHSTHMHYTYIHSYSLVNIHIFIVTH